MEVMEEVLDTWRGQIYPFASKLFLGFYIQLFKYDIT